MWGRSQSEFQVTTFFFFKIWQWWMWWSFRRHILSLFSWENWQKICLQKSTTFFPSKISKYHHLELLGPLSCNIYIIYIWPWPQPVGPKKVKTSIFPSFIVKLTQKKHTHIHTHTHLVWGFFVFQCFVIFLIFAFSCLSFSSFPLLLDFLKPESGPSNEVVYIYIYHFCCWKYKSWRQGNCMPKITEIPCFVRDSWPITVSPPCLGHPKTCAQKKESKFTPPFLGPFLL